MQTRMKLGRMIYAMNVQVEYKKGHAWIPKVAEIVSAFDTNLELTASHFHRAELKAQCFARSSAAFKKSDNFRIKKILDKKPISRSFYYFEK